MLHFRHISTILAVALLLPLWGGAAEASTRRFAVVVGNNEGTGARPALRYAERDADKMARALREVGEVAPDDVFVLKGRGPKDLSLLLGRVQRAVRAAKARSNGRVLLFFYFSGHGDGEALELGRERVSFSQLKALLAGTGADTRIAVIDACQSGAAILEKGGIPAEAFRVQVATQLGVTGDVFVTSTAANESALESSELEGSFFTSHFVSGLRGAADASGDRQVTLTEVYRYAYERTVTATALTPVGSQHPSYKYELSGQGEIVLASLDRAPARMELPKDADRVIVIDAAEREVVAEVVPGAARSLALAPGRYQVRTVRKGKSTTTTVLLTRGAQRELRPYELDGPEPIPEQATPPAPAPVTAAVAKRPPLPLDDALRLCVLGFRNLTRDQKLDYLGDAMSEAIVTDFGENKGIKLVERGQVELNLEELEFAAGKYVNPASRAELGRLHGAEVVVVGSYQRLGAKLRFNGRFVRVETGEILHAIKVERSAADLLAFQDAVALEVRGAVGVLRQRLR